MMDAENVISAFSEDQAERLTGITTSQLRYWAKTGFFTPTLAHEPGRTFVRSRTRQYRSDHGNASKVISGQIATFRPASQSRTAASMRA
jgi:hypothetical protein